MPLPILLTLVRHGHSEGNVAVHASRRGDDCYFTDDYISRHSANLRLTDRGREEAKQAGLWLRNHDQGNRLWFTHFYVSTHLRAMETAGLLGIADSWQADFRLREREFGDWDMNSYSNRAADKRFAELTARKRVEGVYWRPPNGDSIADDAANHVSSLLNEWSALPNGASLIAVTHNDKMRAFQLLLNREGPHTLAGQKPRFEPVRMTNCHIIQYSRWDPDVCRLSDHYQVFRSISFPPQDIDSAPWTRLRGQYWQSQEMLAYAGSFPRVISQGD